MKTLVLAALFQAALPQQTVTEVYTIRHDCITEIDTEGVYLEGPDLKHMVAYGLRVHYTEGCEIKSYHVEREVPK